MRYRDLPYEGRRKIVSLVFEEAERMKEDGKRINYSELSRRILAKTGIMLCSETIRHWFTGKYMPMGKFKAIRRCPDENAQMVKGLLITDLKRTDTRHTIWLSLFTTKDFYARSIERFLARYGWATVRPMLVHDIPTWWMSAYLDYEAWAHELERPIEQLTREEKLKLLSGAIAGDGCITIHTNQRRIRFKISLCSTQKRRIKTFSQILKSLSIPHSLTKSQVRGRRSRIRDLIIRTRAYYEYLVTVEARIAVKYLLTNLKLVHPFREVKRVLALRFIEKDVLDRDLVKPVWDYLRFVEKYSTIRSQIRACELIPDEKFDEKHLNKKEILRRLRGKLYECADRVRELKPIVTRIISSLRVPQPLFFFGKPHADKV